VPDRPRAWWRSSPVSIAVAALNPTWVSDSFLPYLKALEEDGFDLRTTITDIGEKKTRFKEIPMLGPVSVSHLNRADSSHRRRALTYSIWQSYFGSRSICSVLLGNGSL